MPATIYEQKPREDGGHDCLRMLNPSHDEYSGYSHAVWGCREDTEGRFWAYNDEYETRVNFCPFCGTQARPRSGV